MSKFKDVQMSIRTQTEYTDSHRFRIWSAIVEDMDLLGMGYRAYHSHIFESFRKWEAQGFEFLNPKGGRLFLDALKADDIYGFLGRKKQLPKGPKRKLETSKIAVFDAFLTAKFPKLPGFIPPGELSLVHSQMANAFNGIIDDNTVKKDNISSILAALDGIFIHNPFFASDDLEIMIRHMGETGWGIPLFFVNSRPHSGFCIVHKVYLPIRSEYFENRVIDSNDWEFPCFPVARKPHPTRRMEIDSRNQNGKNSIEIWSGIGIVIPHNYSNPMATLECILKHRESGESDISRLLIESEYERCGDDFTIPSHATTELIHNRQGVFAFLKKRAHFDRIQKIRIHSSEFADAIFEIKDKLGYEV